MTLSKLDYKSGIEEDLNKGTPARLVCKILIARNPIVMTINAAGNVIHAHRTLIYVSTLYEVPFAKPKSSSEGALYAAPRWYMERPSSSLSET